MKEIIPLADFTGYPEDKKTVFVCGVSQEVNSAYADLLVEKGLAKEPKASKKAK